MTNEPVSNFKKDREDLGSSALPSRQEAFLSGVLLNLCRQSPAMYAYLRDADVDEDGKCWLVFFKLPPEVMRNLAQVINVEDKKAYEFQQHGILFTALNLEPSEEEMRNLEHYYHDKGDEEAEKVTGPDEQEDSTDNRLANAQS